jgi:hypothetical protein
VLGPKGSLLDLLGVRFVVASGRRGASQALASRPDRFVQIYADAGVRVFENIAALPRAWIVSAPKVRVLPEEQILEALTAPTFEGGNEAILAASHPLLASRDGPCAEEGPVRVRAGDDSYTLDVRRPAGCSGLLVLSESFDPGWRATADGSPADVLQVDHALIGVPLPAAEVQTVELRYIPPGWRFGSAISLASLVSTIALMARARRSGATLEAASGSRRRAR